MKKILIVGQTPPPYGGQAIMIQYMLDAKYQSLQLYHVRMCFSKEFSQRGKFSFYKIWHLFSIIFSIWKVRWTYGVHTMYYPLCSSPKVALIRDVIILMCTRWLFKDIVYHFHSSGISEELPKYPFIVRYLIFAILRKPSLGITSSSKNPKDSAYLQAKREAIIPLGIPDENRDELRKDFRKNPYMTVMFMGLLNGTKGEGYILEAIHQLNQRGLDIRFVFAGKFETEEYKNEFFQKVKTYNLEDKVDYRGIVSGNEKRQLFLDADVFCFPSFFSSESFGIVLLEAMMYQMPLIASKWRGVQSVVEDGKNGFFVDIRNSEQIAQALKRLFDDRMLFIEMAKASRQLFKEKYEIQKYLHCIEEVLLNIN